MERIAITVDEIREGDEFRAPNGAHVWTALEHAGYASGQTTVKVQYAADGGVSYRAWDDRSDEAVPIIVNRP